jgi:hypothetical protein
MVPPEAIVTNADRRSNCPPKGTEKFHCSYPCAPCACVCVWGALTFNKVNNPVHSVTNENAMAAENLQHLLSALDSASASAANQ